MAPFDYYSSPAKTMKPNYDTTTRIIIDHRVVQVDVDTRMWPKEIDVAVRANDRKWAFNEPGWRPLNFGIANGQFYWWSAQHLVSLNGNHEGHLESIEVDEDIEYVFKRTNGWIVVCEHRSVCTNRVKKSPGLNFST